jgi:TonB family protein
VFALASAFTLNACKTEHEENPKPAGAVNNNGSAASTPSVLKIESSTPPRFTTTPLPSAARSPAASRTASSDRNREVYPSEPLPPQNNNVLPSATLPYPGTGSGVGPGRGGGSLDNPNPIRRDPSKIDYNQVFTSGEVDRRAHILEKPTPGYTEAARRDDVNGTVVLGVVLATNGQVTDVKVILGLPDGLTDLAIAAAKRIKSDPARINGRAVSTYIEVQYNVNLY